MNACKADYHKKDCLVHSDSHVFNILAESKPSIDHLEEVGPHGTVVLWKCATEVPLVEILVLHYLSPLDV